MALWGNTANTINAPKWKNISSGTNAAGVDLYANVTPGAFSQNSTVGVFGVDNANVVANGAFNQSGWMLAVHLEGAVTGVAVNNVGTNWANGESIKYSGGSVNCFANAVTNATGNLVSFALTNTGGLFTNLVSIVQSPQRQKHLNDIAISAGGSGYNNTDTILVSNATPASGLINGTATLATNATGGITSITLTNVGLFGNAVTNTQVLISILAANGSASVGTGATLAANLRTSTNGNTTLTLGGNANRIKYETLVAMSSIAGDSGVTIPTK